jgi:hypothetical protein
MTSEEGKEKEKKLKCREKIINRVTNKHKE